MQETLVRSSMQHVIDLLVADISSIRTGRASPGLVEGLEVVVYGGQQKLRLREVASITAPDTQLLVIEPWDKSIIGEIRKSLMEANVGLNPSIDGELLRIVLPPMTTEDREKYVKLLSGKLEGSRVSVRQIRGDAMHSIKKSHEAKEISKDERFAQEKKLQSITDEFIAKIESIGERKKTELLLV